MSDIQFPDGIQVFAKSPNAPEWVGDSIVIDKNAIIKWLQGQPDKVRLQVATSKNNGKMYLKVDNYTPRQGWQQGQRVSNVTEVPDANDLPF